MQRKILPGICFTAILLALLALASLIFLPKNNREEDRVYYSFASGILAEPENSIDAVFLGDSEAYCAFIPLQIWQEQGITTYVCSSVDQKLYETEEILEMVFQKQQPKLVILETNVLYREYNRTETISPAVERLLPIFRYHDRWKTMDPAESFAPVDYREVNPRKGYRLWVEALPADAENYMFRTDVAYACPPQNLPRLANMDAYCREHGAQLVLLSSPSTLNWSTMMYNYMEPLAREMGIPFIDTNQLRDRIPIDWDRDTVDRGDHLNYSGAVKLTGWVGDWLAETGLFSDKRGTPEYADWDRYARQFEADVAAEYQALEPQGGS